MADDTSGPAPGETAAAGGSGLHLAGTIALIAALWAASDLGYYLLLPALAEKYSYNDGPIVGTLYYIFWAGIAVIVFWPQYTTWPLYARWNTFENRLLSLAVWCIAFAAGVGFVAYVVPALPAFVPVDGWKPPELAFATGWYFLPKSIEILFQQLLVVALVLTLSAQGQSLRRVSLVCAALFGAAHILLAFDDVPWGYVVRFAMLAAVFGFAFPYLILRVPNGLAYSYVTHWAYYALTVVMARLLGPGAVLNFLKQIFS